MTSSSTNTSSFSVKSIRISEPLLCPTCCRRVCLSLYYNNNSNTGNNAAPSSSIAVLNVSATFTTDSSEEAGKIDWAVTYRPSSVDHDPLGLLANPPNSNNNNNNNQESVVTCLLAVEKIPSDWLFSNQSQNNNNIIGRNSNNNNSNSNNNPPHIFVVVSSNTKEIAKFDPKSERVVSRIRGRHYNNNNNNNNNNNQNNNNNNKNNFSSSSYEIRDLLWLPSSNILVVHFSHELELFSCGDSTISLCAVSLQLSPQQQHLFGNQDNNNTATTDEKSVSADPPMLWPLMSGHVQVLQCWGESSIPSPLLNCRVVTPIVDATARHVCRCVSLTLPITATNDDNNNDDVSHNHHFNDNHSLVFPFLKRITDDDDDDNVAVDNAGDDDDDGNKSNNNTNNEEKSNHPAGTVTNDEGSSNQSASAPLRFPLVFSRIETSCQYGATTTIDDNTTTTATTQQQQQQQQRRQPCLTTVTTQDIIAHDSNRKPIALCDWTDPGRLYAATRAGTCVHVLEEVVVSESNGNSAKGMLSIVGGRGSLGDSTRQMTSAVTGWISSWTTSTAPKNTKTDVTSSLNETSTKTMTVDQINSRRMIQKSKLRRYLVDYNQNLLYSIATSPNRDVLTCGVRTIHYFKNENNTTSSEQNESPQQQQGAATTTVNNHPQQQETSVASPTSANAVAAPPTNGSNVGLLMNRLDKMWSTASSAVIASVSSAGGNYQWAVDYPNNNNNNSDGGADSPTTPTTPSLPVVAPAVPIVAMFLPKSNLVVALPIDMKSISWLRKNTSSNNTDAAIIKTQNLL